MARRIGYNVYFTSCFSSLEECCIGSPKLDPLLVLLFLVDKTVEGFPPEFDWAVVNVNWGGYYRVWYDQDGREALLAQLDIDPDVWKDINKFMPKQTYTNLLSYNFKTRKSIK